MRTFDKVMTILGFLSTLVVAWHMFAPRDMWIDGFYGYPIVIFMGIIGYSLSCGMENID